MKKKCLFGLFYKFAGASVGGRNTDDIGWHDKNTIGIIMHNTTSNSAWFSANSLVKECATLELDCKDILRFKIYSNPNDCSNIDGDMKNS